MLFGYDIELALKPTVVPGYPMCLPKCATCMRKYFTSKVLAKIHVFRKTLNRCMRRCFDIVLPLVNTAPFTLIHQ